MKIVNDRSIIDALRCPICAAPMSVRSDGGAALICTGGRTHCYDIATSGYVNLCSPKQSGGGDSKQAVSARRDFLNGHHYRPIAEALRDIVCAHADKSQLVLDAGCGEGYYSSFIASSGYSVFGVDISKFAAMAAAKRLGREGLDNCFFATASVFELPLANSSVGTVTSIFAPCAEEEFSRVLCDGGLLIVVWAGEDHLMGLKRTIYSDVRINTGRADLPQSMTLIEEKRVRYTLELENNRSVMELFSMTPYYWRTSAADADKLKDAERLTTEIDVMISVYKNDKNEKTEKRY